MQNTKFIVILFLLFSAILATDFAIHLKEQVDFKNLRHPSTNVHVNDLDWDERGKLVYNALREVADRSQRNIIEYLKSENVEFYPFWISNTIIVKNVSKEIFTNLIFRDEIDRIEGVFPIKLEDTKPRVLNDSEVQKMVGPEWNVLQVKAPEAWRKGITGKGIVVAIHDTGVNYGHTDLLPKYRGRKGGHDYNWFDGVKDKRCKTQPCDLQGHGSHVAGTIVGGNAVSQVGVATNADWIACRALDHTGSAQPEWLLTCFQWFLAPTTVHGARADPSKRPHIINNSWGSLVKTTTFDKAIEALQAAGTFILFAAGNSGPMCGTIGWPGGNPEVFTVGATDKMNILAYFSSRGPIPKVTYLKPEIVAPGQDIKSCSHQGNDYVEMSGTSMATPCAAGVAALLLSARKDLIGKVEDIKRVLCQTAMPLKGKGCSSQKDHPNNMYGYGLIDALRATNSRLLIL